MENSAYVRICSLARLHLEVLFSIRFLAMLPVYVLRFLLGGVSAPEFYDDGEDEEEQVGEEEEEAASCVGVLPCIRTFSKLQNISANRSARSVCSSFFTLPSETSSASTPSVKRISSHTDRAERKGPRSSCRSVKHFSSLDRFLPWSRILRAGSPSPSTLSRQVSSASDPSVEQIASHLYGMKEAAARSFCRGPSASRSLRAGWPSLPTLAPDISSTSTPLVKHNVRAARSCGCGVNHSSPLALLLLGANINVDLNSHLYRPSRHMNLLCS
ncbi:hypothetical protein KP509_37G003600 [Ceratopteris richardii]|uniref:Uncharacterized protein n=1 Tax=Ceratopteris richardii TaxID=49495 RepID=A0A8T2Q562_CERRI|nr:hypothetical protein KP509_37G003600 [Ceratopteris richardii]